MRIDEQIFGGYDPKERGINNQHLPELGVFAQVLSFLMIKNDVTIPQMSDITGRGRGSVCHWMNGTYWPHMTAMLDIADYFELSVDDLLSLRTIEILGAS